MKSVKWNSPVVLSFALISGLALILNILTAGASNRLVFSVYKGSLTDPLFYVRLFTHVLGHMNFSHYTNNMILFLMVGPLLEEKYGSRCFLEIIAVTAFITGLIHVLLPFRTMLLGASGVDFALIILASITGTRKAGEIPMTLIIVALIYIGQQVYEGVFVADNISQLTHIIGGLVGAFCGMYLSRQ